MSLMLGLDTGGTYTDAVLYDDAAPHPGVVAKAKALTTRQDLAVGIAGAIDAVLADRSDDQIAMVSLSTTLATNALVEGQGGRICLVMIGFGPDALNRAGLGQALGADPVVYVAGGLDAAGGRQAALDQAAVEAAARDHGPHVDAFAVIAHFGTRDPSDEKTASEILATCSDRPVTCGHELAHALGGPKRAVTALLNARLIGMISNLITSTEHILSARSIDAPLMLVRGDGALVSADFAKARPIETILSGPAASLVGAAHLTESLNAVVSDIGGTTTDIAVLNQGRPALSSAGAIVGSHSTMVEAVAVTTHGLGGDSAVQVDDTALSPRLILGPRRLIPLSLLAAEYPDAVHTHLDEALSRPNPGEHDGRFLLANPGAHAPTGLKPTDQSLLDRLGPGPVPAATILRNRMDGASLNRLVARGLVLSAGLTPSDAAHVLGDHVPWDAIAASKGATLLAARRTAAGTPVAPNAEALSRLIQQSLRRRSAEVLLDTALTHDGLALPRPSEEALAQLALDGHRGAARVQIGLDWPLVGLGASAGLYYPGVAAILGTRPIVPDHADVANAIGAVVGQVRTSQVVAVTQPVEGCFRVHAPDGLQDLYDLEDARRIAMSAAKASAAAAANAAGAEAAETTVAWHAQTATIDGRKIFIEGTAEATATGRPRLAEERRD